MTQPRGVASPTIRALCKLARYQMVALCFCATACQSRPERLATAPSAASSVVEDQNRRIPELVTPGKLDANVASAYDKLGAVSGRWIARYGFAANSDLTEGGLPALRFARPLPREELPAIAVPFALVLDQPMVTAEDLKRVAKFQNLAALALTGEVSDEALKELAGLRTLTTLQLAPSRVGDGTLAVLRQIDLLYALERAQGKNGSRPRSAHEVLSLDLQGTQVTDAGLDSLIELENLLTLNLSGLRVTDAGIKKLAPLQSLAVLDLQQTGLTDRGLRELTPLQKLTHLNLESTGVTDVGLAELPRLEHLAILRLRFTNVTNEGLKKLAGVPNLTELDLVATRVTDAGLKQLAGLRKLSHLCLEGEGITDAGLAALVPLKLTALDLIDTRVSDAGLKHVATFANLIQLLLNRTRVTNVGLSQLAGLRKLDTLGLDGEQIDNTTLETLHGIGLLHALTRAEGKHQARPKSAEEVVSLNLGGTRISDRGLKELSGFKNLISLDLQFTAVTDVGLKELVHFKNLTMLQVKLRVTDEGLRHLAALEALTYLDLNGNQVSDAGLRHLAGLKNLATLSLNGTPVTDAGLKELTLLPRLTSLSVANTKVTEAGAAEWQRVRPDCRLHR